jgi:uncharacterized protein YgbK (DUF1537 family)
VSNPETVESLLEYLRVAGRVSVVHLEPPRAREFYEALRTHLERHQQALEQVPQLGAAAERARDAVARAVTAEREACALLCEGWPTLNSYGERMAAVIRARGVK